jgi:hypothetical protein
MLSPALPDGFRPGRSAHAAIATIYNEIVSKPK